MSDTEDKSPVSPAIVAAGALVAVVLAFVAGYFFSQNNLTTINPPTVAGFFWPPPPPVEHLNLIDTSGRVFNETRLNNHWTLVFFGYTHCPDICPTTMHTLNQVHNNLAGYQAFERNGQVLFVSVDAARDTPDVLRTYTDYFNPAFFAAAAPNEELYRLTEQFGVEVRKISGEPSDEYHFDHPAHVLLVGPDNRITGVFAPPLDAADIANQVRVIIEWGDARR